MVEEARFTTLVLGASLHPDRYSFRAVSLLKSSGFKVVAMGVTEGTIDGIPIQTPFTPLQNIHTVTLYLNAKRQEAYFDFIIQLKPKRVLFNPGTENAAFAQLLDQAHIPWENACTLVLLATDQYQPNKGE
ncbi:MAG: CoA-binding protein [Flavobacteriaceae bacterium]|mgnify:FL=1|jgi:uncharacterized protein|nr:CoA-binding protein [Flavobacteriaceae bacterium]